MDPGIKVREVLSKNITQIMEKQEISQIETDKKSCKKENNEITNSLNKEVIDIVVKKLTTDVYLQKKGNFMCNKNYSTFQGKKRNNSLDYKVPYLVKFNNEIFCNPYALSENLNNSQKEKKRKFEDQISDFTGGYFTIPIDGKLLPEELAPKSTNSKSTWHPRVNVHGILWRYYNNYAKIPSAQDISHLSNQKKRVTRGSLIAEEGVINRSRAACFQYKWYTEPKGNGVRCPHEPVCQSPVSEPSDELFRSKDNKVIGNL